MRIPDPYTHPGLTGLGFESVALIDNDPLLRDELPNATVREVRIAGQHWGINIDYPDLFENEFKVLDSFLLEYKRKGDYIDVLLPQYETFRVAGATANTTIASGQKGSTIVIDTKGTLRGEPEPGDLFKLSTHAKVYKITSFSKVGNVWTLGLYPNLFITTSGVDKPIFTGILFQTKLMNGDAFSTQFNADGVYPDITLTLRESV